MQRGRKPTYKSAKQMWDAWCKYREECNNRVIQVNSFSAKNSEFVEGKVKGCVTVTIKGFAVWSGMTEQNFYATYGKNEKFESVIARIREECEIDAREKFELGLINPKLAGLWMSRYGYAKTEVLMGQEEREAAAKSFLSAVQPDPDKLRELYGNGPEQ